MKPLVSILIPAYNAEEWIPEAIHSAIAQTWPHKEIIVVDDGSWDRTAEVAQRLASIDVKVVSPENQGAAAMRNYLYSLSQGDYIQWLDADDVLLVAESQALAEQLQGHLGTPRLQKRYAWVIPLIGRKATKWLQGSVPQLKAGCVRHWDKAMYRFDASRAVSSHDDKHKRTVWEGSRQRMGSEVTTGFAETKDGLPNGQ